MKKTLVIGTSLNTSRYSNLVIQRLTQAGHPVEVIGLKEGVVAGISIKKEKESFKQIDTITLYLKAEMQADYYEYILSLNPKRVIFNPGTENPELYKLLKENNINFEASCTLVLLATNQY